MQVEALDTNEADVGIFQKLRQRHWVFQAVVGLAASTSDIRVDIIIKSALCTQLQNHW